MQSPSEDRAVRTTTLSHLLSHFKTTHVDLLIADCEGCELKAIKGLNLSTTTVDVFMVEEPACELYEMFHLHDYVGLPFSKRNDMVWVHRVRIASKMRKPPTLVLAAIDNYHSDDLVVNVSISLERKARLAKVLVCPRVPIQNIWDESLPWLPEA